MLGVFLSTFFVQMFLEKSIFVKNKKMGLTYATIEVSNGYDISRSEDGLINKNEIRRWSGEMLVDSGAIRMAINEEIKAQLGLKGGMITPVTLANGTVTNIELVGNLICTFWQPHLLHRCFCIARKHRTFAWRNTNGRHGFSNYTIRKQIRL